MTDPTVPDFINAMYIILGSMDGLLLLFGVIGIIVGAVNMQSGNPQKQEQGKETIKNAAIGTGIGLIAIPIIAVVKWLVEYGFGTLPPLQ